MFHAFKHFIFRFKTAVFKPADDSAAAQPETDFKNQEKNPHYIKVKTSERFGIKHKLQEFDDKHTDQPFPQSAVK